MEETTTATQPRVSDSINVKILHKTLLLVPVTDVQTSTSSMLSDTCNELLNVFRSDLSGGERPDQEGQQV